MEKKKKKKKLMEKTSSSLEEYINLSEQIINGEKVTIHQLSSVFHEKQPRITVDSTGKITEIRVSTSLIKKLLYKGNSISACPYYIYHLYLLRDIEEPVTESMLRGLYFETMTIGSSANNEGTYDLPRNKLSGEKLIPHIRIDDAVDRFHRMNEKYGIIIDKKYVQYHAERIWIDKYKRFSDLTIIIQGDIDFLSPVKYESINFPVAIFDLKLTADRDNCYPPFCWGCPKEMDLTQAIMYSNLTGLPFFYYVFDYRKFNPDHMLLPVKTIITHPQDKEAIQRNLDLDQSIRHTVATIQYWETNGWQQESDKDVCKQCPIQCDKWKKIKEI